MVATAAAAVAAGNNQVAGNKSPASTTTLTLTPDPHFNAESKPKISLHSENTRSSLGGRVFPRFLTCIKCVYLFRNENFRSC